LARLLNYFLRGLVVLVPVALTVWITVEVFRLIDGWLGLPIPGVGFLITLLLITLIGFLASNLLTRRVVAAVEGLFVRLPLVRLLYSATRDLLNAFVGEKRRFDVPVLVRIGAPDVRVLGFVTRDAVASLGLPGHMAVYVPQSYNFAGQLLVVTAESVERVDSESAEIMAFIVSGGVTETGEKAGALRDRSRSPAP
jgi:uncharacterized membrane protein